MSWDIVNQISSLPSQQQWDILNGAALPPPENVTPNLENPPNGNTLTWVVLSVCFALVTLAVLLRAYVKIFVFRKLYLEDALAFIGFAMTIAYYCCCCSVLSQVGFLIHQWDMRVKDLYQVLYFGNMAFAFYEVAISTLKVAILLEWNKLFAPNRSPKSFYWTCYILLWVNIVYYITSIIVSNIVCFPILSEADTPSPGICLNKATAEAVSATLNLVSHVLVFVLPQKIIWKLNMTTKKKIGVSLIFAIGILVVVAGICRLSTTIQYFTDTDLVYVGYRVYLWCAAELTLLVLVFCVPTIPKIFSEGTQVSKIPALSGPWSRLFTRRSNTNKGSTQVDLEKNQTASENIHQWIALVDDSPPKHPEHRDENQDTQALRSAQLQQEYNNSQSSTDDFGGFTRTVHTDTFDEHYNSSTTLNHRPFFRS
ncbi:hypothetical protein F4805DRAFT_453552 [Annulohypoxylon moriforme]|nr:hypothetical protein F4805DRAFT_453552 [Annulohypoxylon moriforme]